MKKQWKIVLSAGLAATAVAEQTQPNVLLIVADDLGLGDVGCYGSKWIRTPNIDRLAADGIRALDAHATASVCTPSRYSILTGRYYHRYPFNWNGESLVEADRPTIASVFRDNGYATGYFGKVHTGWGERSSERKHRQDIDWNSELPRGVLEMGFDTFNADGTIKTDAPDAQLYNLRKDPRQLTNVIRDYPEKAAELAARFNEVKKRQGNP